jgi:hypothetical protein
MSPPELASRHAETPIYHKRYYQGERELFGYDPAFVPNVVTFDEKNRPYMRVGTHIQWLAGWRASWALIDLAPYVAAKYPNWDGGASNLSDLGYNVDEHVVFDKYNNAYTFLDSMTWSGVGVALILYRPGGQDQWKVYVPPTALRFGYPEYADGHNDRSEPPVFLFTSYFGPDSLDPGPIELLMPHRNADDSLSFGSPITVATDAVPHVRGAGGSNLTVTIGGRVHVVWDSHTAGNETGTPTWIATYSRTTGNLLAGPKLVGYAGIGDPDNHNLPAITVDTKGYLHVILGAHHEQFKYTRSLLPNDITGGFTPLVSLGGRTSTDGKDADCNDDRCYLYTYVSLACDQDDTLHLVTRWAGDTPQYTYYFRLAYLRQKAGHDWEPRRSLVVPFKAYYSNWYQKISIDHRGHLFVNYRYYGDQLFADEVAAYNTKWPADPLTPDDPACVPTLSSANPAQYCSYSNSVKAHDPVLLMSLDHGNSFRVMTTEGLRLGIDPQTP